MRGFRAAVGLGLVSRLLSIGVRFVSVPLIITLLSAEKYGLWLIASSIVGWLAISDLGMPAALQNRLIDLLRKNQGFRAKRLVAFAFRLLGWIGLVIATAGIIAAVCVPWKNFFPISEGVGGEFVATLCMCTFGLALGLPTRIGVVLYNANGVLHVGPLSEIAAQGASLVLLLVAVSLHWNSLLALSACTLAGVAMVPLFVTFNAVRRFGYSLHTTISVDERDKKALVGKGFFFALAAIGELLILQSDSILIGIFLGPAAVPLYAVPSTLFINFLQLQNIYLKPLWPLITTAAAEGNRADLVIQFKKAIVLCGSGSFAFAFGLAVFGDWFVRLWSRGLVGLPIEMAVGFGFYAILASIDSLCATFLNAANAIKYRCAYTIFFGLVKSAAVVFFVTRTGVSWLPLLFAGTILVSSLPFALMGIRKYIFKAPA